MGYSEKRVESTLINGKLEIVDHLKIDDNGQTIVVTVSGKAYLLKDVVGGEKDKTLRINSVVVSS